MTGKALAHHRPWPPAAKGGKRHQSPGVGCSASTGRVAPPIKAGGYQYVFKIALGAVAGFATAEVAVAEAVATISGAVVAGRDAPMAVDIVAEVVGAMARVTVSANRSAWIGSPGRVAAGTGGPYVMANNWSRPPDGSLDDMIGRQRILETAALLQ